MAAFRALDAHADDNVFASTTGKLLTKWFDGNEPADALRLFLKDLGP